MANVPSDFAELMGIALGFQRSRALMVAAELGVADLLRDGSLSVSELAHATRTHEPTLYRLAGLPRSAFFTRTASGAAARGKLPQATASVGRRDILPA